MKEAERLEQKQSKINDRNYSEESTFRAIRNIKRIVRNNVNGNWFFITLTYSYFCDDINKVLNDVKNMIKRYEEYTKKDFQYIMCLEYHTDESYKKDKNQKSSLHCHLLVKDFFVKAPDSAYFKDFFTEKFWQQGKISKIDKIRNLKDPNRFTLAAVNYMIKYVSKNFDEYQDKFKRHYWRSHNFNENGEKVKQWKNQEHMENILFELYNQGFTDIKIKEYNIPTGETLTIMDIYKDFNPHAPPNRQKLSAAEIIRLNQIADNEFYN